VVTDKLRSYGAAMKVIGNANKQDSGRWLNSRGDNSHPLPGSGLSTNHKKGPFRRRERAMLGFRNMLSLQKLAAVHSSVHNHFNMERPLYSRVNFKFNRDAALCEKCQLCSAKRDNFTALQETGSHPSDTTATCPRETFLPIRLRPDISVVLEGYACGAVHRPLCHEGKSVLYGPMFSGPVACTGLVNFSQGIERNG
jgi:hypothetical protein